ncbi:E3 ubiquitin-protein ligase MIB2 isoform X1 [Lepeophtheirus salmonis]|uniref:E3 ubiquitin-protein ligase MIB2 isoform X1 n=2 Tax=Lepeophtheirus salmonis TaxID=72036 RepID=UPI001AEAC58E|nr:E3 ubiquitin-protein ligase MIB2-like isoform X1 [Lepeophtheirus salmonis]XP_040581832.1 E3 ubiquitin-protein ligase MIB2-like isoform X1 [Lepeophtheirus salmonis]XP_040581842.1 E3 ubiquitin-protein ligase MIB2-like isoform X1 [Lepeophtheirus salmonis]
MKNGHSCDFSSTSDKQFDDGFTTTSSSYLFNEKNKRKSLLIPNNKEECFNLENFIESLQALLEKDSSFHVSNYRTMIASLGIRVVRGPDWKWGEQDDGIGHAGTVVEFGRSGSNTSPDGTVVVQWDSGIRTNYRMGFQKAYDLRIYDIAASGVQHPNHSCVYCKTRILGYRWSCSSCPELDYCNGCYNSDIHDLSHSFIRIDTPTSVPVQVPPRKKSLKIPLRGIFKGAWVHRGHDWDWGAQDGGEDNIGIVLDVSGWDEESGRSVVTVKWNSTFSTNVYRLGHKGKVDVKYVSGKQAFHGFYYPEHLPILGDKKYSGSSSNSQSGSGVVSLGFSVGDKVKIKVDAANFKNLQNGFGGYSPRMTELIGQIGIIHRFTDKGAVRVQYPGRPIENHRWTINPKALVKVTMFTIGTIVRIINDCDKVRRLQEGHGDWIESMKSVIGKMGRVVKVYPDRDVRVSIMGNTWTFNPTCLVIVPGSRLDIDNRADEFEGEGETSHRRSNPSHLNLSEDNLLSSAFHGQLNCLKEELHKVNDIKTVRSALKVGAERGHLDIVKYLVNQYPDEVDLKVDGNTALHAATHQGHQEIIETLLASGANIATTDDNGDCALHYAVLGLRPNILDYLLSKSGSSVINAVNKKCCTALHVGVLKQSVESVKILLKHNIDVNAQDSYKDTALHEAMVLNNTSIIELLVNYPKTDFRLKNSRDFNCLQFAALKGNTTALKSILVKARQLAEVKKSDGFSPLHLAALNGHYSIVKILLKVGKCSVDIFDNRGQNPLHLASGQGHAAIVELLVNHVKDNQKLLLSLLESQDSEGQTPLHLALGREGSVEPLDPLQAPEMNRILGGVLTAAVKPELQRSLTIAIFLSKNGASLSKRNMSGLVPQDLIPDPVLRNLLMNKKSIIHKSSSPSRESVGIEYQVECLICTELSSQLITFRPCGHRVVCIECWTPRIKKCLDCKAPLSHKTESRIPSKSTSNISKKDYLLPRMRDLEAKVRDFEDQFLCTICMERKKNVAFQCGHSACEICVETLRSCHMCRGPVDRRINLY